MNAHIGRIPFLNSAPFYTLFADAGIPLIDMAPRAMGEAARRGEIDAGPLSLLDFVSLEPQFEPVGDFIIGVKQAAGSVAIFSRVPIPELTNDSTLGLDPASTTSATLARIILRERYHVTPRLVPFAYEAADAVLVIGDVALQALNAGLPGYPHVLDLGSAWWEWHRLPFVFAVWAARVTMPQGERETLANLVGHSIRVWNEPHGETARYAVWTEKLLMPEAKLRAYMNGLVHHMGPDEEEAVMIFKTLVGRLGDLHIVAQHSR